MTCGWWHWQLRWGRYAHQTDLEKHILQLQPRISAAGVNYSAWEKTDIAP